MEWNETKELDWNFSYLIADASGRHGIVEIAQNKVVFLEENIQTNFYLTKEFADIEDYKAGLGRYEYLKSRYDLIRDDQTMFDVMNAVSYQQIYLENPRFDERSELVGIKPEWTSNYLFPAKSKKKAVLSFIFSLIKKKNARAFLNFILMSSINV